MLNTAHLFLGLFQKAEQDDFEEWENRRGTPPQANTVTAVNFI